MSRPTCCNGDCNQGRACPDRTATPGGFGSVLLLALLVGVLVLLAGCKRADVIAAEQREEARRYGVYFYDDADTGCQYVGNKYGPATPRIAADGKTHMGCRQGAKP